LNLYSLSQTYLLSSGPTPGSIQRTIWSSAFGLPVTAWALLVYVILLLSLLCPRTPRSELLTASIGWTLIFIPAWFMSLQAFVLHQICAYCVASHLIGVCAGVCSVILSKFKLLGACIGLALMLFLIGYQIIHAYCAY